LSTPTFPPIPLETVKAAEAVFGKSHAYLVIGKQANSLFAGLSLGASSGSTQPLAHKRARLSLVTIFQYIETLPDHLAFNAFHERVDWKYALHLPLKHPRLEGSALCEFRRWLLSDGVSEADFNELLVRLAEDPQISFKQQMNLETVQVVACVCVFSRLANIWEAINQAIESLATSQPAWLRGNSLPHWYERYGRARENLNLKADTQAQQAFAQSIGADGFYLLDALAHQGTPEMVKLPEISTLRQAWNEQFERVGGKVHWRGAACAGCSLSSRLHYGIQ
jgi:transposase